MSAIQQRAGSRTVDYGQPHEMVCFVVNIRGPKAVNSRIEMIFMEPGMEAHTTTDWLIKKVKGRLGLSCFLRYQLLYRGEHALRADVLLAEEFPRGAALTMEPCSIDSYQEFVPKKELLERKMARLEEQVAAQACTIRCLNNELNDLKKWRDELDWSLDNFATEY